MELKEVETRIASYEQHLVSGDSSGSFIWMGISIEWMRRPKYAGGNIKRKGQWGVLVYRDSLKNDRELTREQAIKEILRPAKERAAESDLTNIIYCGSCGKTGIGYEEQLDWGHLTYTSGIVTYPSTGHKSARHKHIPLCYKCCREIINGELGK